MKRPLILATLALSACAAPEPEQPGPTPVQAAPTAPGLTITPHPLISAQARPGANGIAIALRRTNGAINVRLRLADGSYPSYWGGAAGFLVRELGDNIGPLDPGTVFEVHDGTRWVTFARFQ